MDKLTSSTKLSDCDSASARFPFVFLLVAVCRLLRLYASRLFNLNILVSSNKDKIDLFVNKMPLDVRHERNIEDFK